MKAQKTIEKKLKDTQSALAWHQSHKAKYLAGDLYWSKMWSQDEQHAIDILADRQYILLYVLNQS